MTQINVAILSVSLEMRCLEIQLVKTNDVGGAYADRRAFVFDRFVFPNTTVYYAKYTFHVK